jgi:hypothetical protein
VLNPVFEASMIPMASVDPINSNLLNTFEENKTFYTKSQIARAQAARNFSRALGCPSDSNLRAIIRSNSVRDCPIVENDVTFNEQIFSKDVTIIKGKTTQKKPTVVLHDTFSNPLRAEYGTAGCNS